MARIHRNVCYFIALAGCNALAQTGIEADAGSDANPVADPVAQPVTIGSKNFNESYLLAEIMAQALENAGIEVKRQFGFGGTMICYEALRTGEIDIYPEYTGTIRQVILKEADEDITAVLELEGIRIFPALGFNNTYAMAISQEFADQYRIGKISDLADFPALRAGFSHEFLNRADGWPGLAQKYGLSFAATGIEHGLAYEALRTGRIDITDAYSTDGELTRYALRILDDDLGYFPQYLAVPLVRSEVEPRVGETLARLRGALTDRLMRELNAQIVVGKRPVADVASDFLALLDPATLTRVDTALAISRNRARGPISALLRNTRRHLELTLIALVLSCVAGTGLAILVYRSAAWSRTVVYIAGLFQTIPSIALLALMIPLLGVGVVPAVVALFLYSLLPILRNAVTALTTVDPIYREVATAMGLTQAQQLRHVLMPLAAPHILAGIRTAAVISIGTATLAAFIGAGGLGEPIVTGLALNDTNLILQGAIPAALLAIGTELAFSRLERILIPAHLRAH